MPKITPWEDKEDWYVRAERGESVAKMARESRKDPRTLQRGIDDVQHKPRVIDPEEIHTVSRVVGKGASGNIDR